MTDENGRCTIDILLLCAHIINPDRICIAYTIQYDFVCGHMVTMVGRGMYILYYILCSIIEINCAHSIRNGASGSRILFDNEPKRKISVLKYRDLGLGLL